MRLLIHSAPPFVGTGYGAQTALMAPRLQGLGHDVVISSTGGIDASTHTVEGPCEPIIVLPKGRMPWSMDVLPMHVLSMGADAVIALFDAWVLEPKLVKVPLVSYFPVDCEEVPAKVLRVLEQCAVRVAMSRFGQEATRTAGLDCEYVPHCYDPDVYYPRVVSREVLGAAADGFLVGMVASNGPISHASPPRKAFAQCFEGFARFQREHPGAMLYVHAEATEQMGGIDLHALREHYGIPDGAIRFPNPYMLQMGAYAAEDMAEIYSAMDVLLAPSMGEGFGVPILEAQSCGTPVVSGDWTAMSEITRSGVAISKDDAYRLHVPGMGDQWLVDPQAVCDTLVEAVDWSFEPSDVAAKVEEFEADRVVEEYWRPLLEQLEETIRPAAPRLNREQRRRQKAIA